MASLVPFIQHFHKNDGTIASGYYLHFFAGGTTTPQDAYTDQSGGTPTSNPLQLNSRGEAEWWLDPTLSYKILLTTDVDGADVIKEMDVIRSIASGSDSVWQFGESTAIVAASTINLDSMNTSFGHITGNSTINTVTLAQGVVRVCVFDGTPTLTNSATLIINGGTVTVIAGDVGYFYGEGSGVTRCDIHSAATRKIVSLYPTVTSAASPDIFGAAGATVGIDNSTPVTCTDFTDCTASQVGSIKRVIPAQSWTVTASANMTVNGFTSGNYSFPASSIIQVCATSTSTFAINGIVNDTITLTLSGSTGSPSTPVTTTARRIISGKRVSLDFEFSNVDTTGASGNLRVTGALPANSESGYGICETAGFTTTAPQLRIASSIIIVIESGTTGAVAMSAGAGKTVRGSVTYSG